MGNTNSLRARDLGVEAIGDEDRLYGLENFGSTCYINSVLQALFFCRPFRDRLLRFHAECPVDERDDIVFALATLFEQILKQRKSVGYMAPIRLINAIRRHTAQFRTFMHQDAQELLGFLLEHLEAATMRRPAPAGPIDGWAGHGAAGPERAPTGRAGGGSATGGDGCEAVGGEMQMHDLERESTGSEGSSAMSEVRRPGGGLRDGCDDGQDPLGGAAEGPGSDESSATAAAAAAGASAPRSFVTEIFQGKTVQLLCCMNCEHQSDTEQDFLMLHVEVSEPDTTIERVLAASQEILQGDNKYECAGCNAYQEAEKRVCIKTAPPVLIVHLNRLSYMAHLGQAGKVRHRVAFGERLRPPNLVNGDAEGSAGDDGVVYELFAIVVHVGSTSEHGHYVSYIKTAGSWFCFDDATVSRASLTDIQATYGRASEWAFGNDTHAYILFYQLPEVAGAPRVDTPSAASPGGDHGERETEALVKKVQAATRCPDIA